MRLGVIRVELQGPLVACNCFTNAPLRKQSAPQVVMNDRPVRLDLQCLVVTSNRLIGTAQVSIQVPQIIECVGVIRLNLEGASKGRKSPAA